MCGIAGFTFPQGTSWHGDRARIQRMTAALRHRGPDEQRARILDGAALGHARLATVDLQGGRQPMTDPRTGVTLIFNGEIYNHAELRERWSPDYAFRSRSDTEVLLAGFALEGHEVVRRFVGQFAFALFDPRDGSLWLGRDRVGICPLYYANTTRGVAFASELRSIFAGGEVAAALDPRGVHQSIRLWGPLAPRTCFRDVLALPPGHLACLRGHELRLFEYWQLPQPSRERARAESEPSALRALEETLIEAVKLTLRADVPVATYLSGGLDSSLLCAIAQRELGGTLQTFSVGFERPEFDETSFQREAARALATSHTATTIREQEIATLLPQVVRHAEQVLIRSAPAPLFRLSSLVRSSGTRVVLTGEGADEFFLGYDLFKETKLRQFWSRQPKSRLRPLLLSGLYPYMPRMRQGAELSGQFFGLGLEQADSPIFSHQLRWMATARIGRFFSNELLENLAGHDPVAELVTTLPERVLGAPPLERAQYIEAKTLLSSYLLSAQGDRMLLANSVEGRFPFLDHRLIEHASTLPESFKLKVLEEKYLLRRLASNYLPVSLAKRPKQPYRAPIAGALAGDAAPEWARRLLSREAVDAVGVFSGHRVEQLVSRAGLALGQVSEADSMALMAVASTQLLHAQLVNGAPPTRDDAEAVEVEAA
ncbi:MAG TPA: asparagine synthase (glutamine-hydrolyzing) [Polyangiaceae bacterium]|nr:asparagine synthase (glutamine-hydrolyzing) [Polyangiaceae bacterium]